MAAYLRCVPLLLLAVADSASFLDKQVSLELRTPKQNYLMLYCSDLVLIPTYSLDPTRKLTNNSLGKQIPAALLVGIRQHGMDRLTVF